MSEPTNFMESNALLAVQGADYDHAWEILRAMTKTERAELGTACHILLSMINEENATKP